MLGRNPRANRIKRLSGLDQEWLAPFFNWWISKVAKCLVFIGYEDSVKLILSHLFFASWLLIEIYILHTILFIYLYFVLGGCKLWVHFIQIPFFPFFNIRVKSCGWTFYPWSTFSWAANLLFKTRRKCIFWKPSLLWHVYTELARFCPNQKYIYSCLFSLGNVGNCFCCVPHSARLLQFSRMHAPPSSILHTMMTFANPPNSHRFKPYHSKQKADNEVWNWIKFPFSFVGFAQCPARCYAMISMQAGQMKTDARSIPRCKEIFPLKL